LAWRPCASWHLEGARAVILDLRRRREGAAEELWGWRVFVAADVIDPHQVQAAVDAPSGSVQLAVAVNSAGIGNAFAWSAGWALPLDAFRKVIEVNTRTRSPQTE